MVHAGNTFDNGRRVLRKPPDAVEPEAASAQGAAGAGEARAGRLCHVPIGAAKPKGGLGR